MPRSFPVGLVDTGAENVLGAAWLADLAGIDLSAISDTALIGIGGQTAEVAFAEVELRLYSSDATDEFVSWRCDVGFVPGWQAPFALVLGQVGFLDRFTVTFHRGAGMLASRIGKRSTPGSCDQSVRISSSDARAAASKTRRRERRARTMQAALLRHGRHPARRSASWRGQALSFAERRRIRLSLVRLGYTRGNRAPTRRPESQDERSRADPAFGGRVGR